MTVQSATEVISEPALTVDKAVDYLSTKHGLKYSERHLTRLAVRGEAPSHKVGRNRLYRASLLDAWALGEWSRPEPVEAAS